MNTSYLWFRTDDSRAQSSRGMNCNVDFADGRASRRDRAVFAILSELTGKSTEPRMSVSRNVCCAKAFEMSVRVLWTAKLF